jgi:hypothetical protein
MYSLRVIQQPERARLCSFKEENETSKSLFCASASGKKKEGLHADTLVDRRPVDPPPVVELLLDNACVP